MLMVIRMIIFWSSYEYLIHYQVSNLMSFLCQILDPHLTAYHSNIGVHIIVVFHMGTSTLCDHSKMRYVLTLTSNFCISTPTPRLYVELKVSTLVGPHAIEACPTKEAKVSDLKWTLLALHHFLEDMNTQLLWGDWQIQVMHVAMFLKNFGAHINISKTRSSRAKCLIDSDPFQHYSGEVLCREPSNQPCADFLAFYASFKKMVTYSSNSPTKKDKSIGCSPGFVASLKIWTIIWHCQSKVMYMFHPSWIVKNYRKSIASFHRFDIAPHNEVLTWYGSIKGKTS